MTMPFNLHRASFDMDGFQENTYTINIDMDDTRIELNQGFSFDSFYGFETTSEIALRNDADIAVNGMFYDNYGMPYGIIIEDGKNLSISSSGGPVVYIDDEKQVHMDDMAIGGYVGSGDASIKLWGVNVSAPTYAFVLYDRIYGKTTRVYRQSINYLIEDNVVIDIIRSDVAVSTENSDYVLTHITDGNTYYFKIGDIVTIDYEYDIGSKIVNEQGTDTTVEPDYKRLDENTDGIIIDAFQTGGWLVYEGQIVAKAYEPYVGYTTSLQPRTLVGITDDNELVFMVVDGRNPGVSVGVTGTQAARLMIEAGCRYAGYLDGGASSTLVVKGQVINRPSDDGAERAIAHTIMISFD